MIVMVSPRRRPCIETDTVSHARFSLSSQFRRDECAHHSHLLPENRIDIGFVRIHIGRDKQPRSRASHLVHIQDDLGVPGIVYLKRQPGFDLREHVPISVVVVTHILVVEPGHPAPFVLGPKICPIPVHNHLDPIRIVHGYEQEDDIIQDSLGCGIAIRSQVIGQFHGHLRSPDL